MKKNYKTILEAARDLGFTKNAVKYHVSKLPAEMVDKDEKGIVYISPEGVEALRETMGKKQPTEKHQTTDNEELNNSLIETLSKTIETLQSQLTQKDEQLKTSTDEKMRLLQLIDQQQQLTARQLQQLTVSNEKIIQGIEQLPAKNPPADQETTTQEAHKKTIADFFRNLKK